MKKEPETPQPNIVFFDGYCGMCNLLVDGLMKKDKNNKLLFAPLQGKTAKQEIPENFLKDADTILFLSQNQIYARSSAVLKIFHVLGGWWKITVLFKIVPRIFRDGVYNFIAKNRFRWYRRRAYCRIPNEQEKNKILN